LLSEISIPREDNYYHRGDTAVIEIFSLSSDAYLFLEAAMRAENIEPIVALPPANVPSNISNGALGYFLLSAKQYIELPIN
jgi:hypothetical protein